MTVTFFGHGDAPQDVLSRLRAVIIDLIENSGANRFYVGNHGNFDRMVVNVMKEIESEYSIDYAVVFAYMPKSKDADFKHAVFPEEAASASRKFAICRCNEWMIKQSDIVVAYVDRCFGGAYRYMKLAERKGVGIINLACL